MSRRTAWSSRSRSGHSPLGTLLLYGAFAMHFLLALWAVYERRTFRLPPLELLRIALGFTLPILLIGHAANTRLAYDLFGLASDYARVISNLWASGAQGRQLGLMAPGWLHGCLGLHFAFNRRPLYRQLRYVLFGAALLLPVLSALGFIAMGRELAANPAAAAAAMEYLSPTHAAQRIAIAQWRNSCSSAISPSSARPSSRARSATCSSAAAGAWSRSRIPGAPCACRAGGRCWKRAAASISRTPRCAAGERAARPAGCA